jgi:branched-chain amino acid transport system permease protein
VTRPVELLPWAALSVALIAVGAGNPYVLTLGTTTAMAIMVAAALNVSMGLVGSVNIGVGVFYGGGAYTAAVLNTRLGWSILASLVVAMLFAAVVSALLGPILLRARSLYFAIATMALNGIFVEVVSGTQWLGGGLGIAGIQRPTHIGPLPIDLTSLQGMYIATAVALVVVLGVVAWIIRSTFGRILTGIREDELLCRSLGYGTMRYRTAAFVLTGVLAAVPGVLYAFVIQYVNPTPFSFMTGSFQALVVLAVGGAATTWGPVLGGVLLVAGPSLLGFSATTNQYVYGFGLVIIVVFMRGGLAPTLHRAASRAGTLRFRRQRVRRTTGSEPA